MVDTTIQFKLSASCKSPTFQSQSLSGFDVIPRQGEKFKFLDDPMVYGVVSVLHEAGYDHGHLYHRVTVTLIC